ncbi:MAG: response regulator [Deltaproteobacteria bacterium]|nr:response regulator [Deltaproteobacteria bacterium]
MKEAKILFVDDEVVFSENMAALLNKRGYHTITVHDGESAIRSLQENDFDVVVLDLKMPGMDGITTLKEIKKLDIMTEILILTGHGSIDSAMEAVKSGAFDYLTKPCEIDELVEKIEAAWGKKDTNKKRYINDKIQKIVESPKPLYELFSSNKEKI